MTRLDPLDRLRLEIAGHLRITSAPSAPTPNCLDDASATALAEGTPDPVTRAAMISHLATCSRCRGTVASVTRALGDPIVARAVSEAEGGRPRTWRLALPAAVAAALLLVFTWPRPAEDASGAHRERAMTSAPAPVLESPVGTVAGAAILQWSAVSGADQYRVTMYDTRSHVLFETELADTVATLPDSIRLAPGETYLWKVEARTGWDRWSASELAEFRIARGGQP